ncbi:hypothetical protein CKO09_12185 [Chromatium weissei]|nr:hypothetical protein [Chromatium weissei]
MKGDLIAPPPPKLRPKPPAASSTQVDEKAAVPIAKSISPPVKKIAPAPRRERAKTPIDAAELDYPDPNLSPAQERELQRLLDGESVPVNDAEIAAPARFAPSKSAPIPPDLIDEIEAFKQQIKREQGAKFHHE